MLVVDGLTCRFGAKAAVDDASFQVSPGGFVGVIGRSGAGKSTLLRTINRLATPSQGRILFDGLDVTALRGKELRQWRARSAMIFQQLNLVGRLDVLTNVLMGRLATMPAWRSLTQAWPEQDKALAMSALEQFDIASLAAQRADQLSGGQQQRVAIARAVAMQPRLLLFDEVTSALDPELVAEVLGVMQSLAESGMTMLLVSHEMLFVREVSHHVLFLDQGRVAQAGAPSEVFDNPESERLRSFLGRFHGIFSR